MTVGGLPAGIHFSSTERHPVYINTSAVHVHKHHTAIICSFILLYFMYFKNTVPPHQKRNPLRKKTHDKMSSVLYKKKNKNYKPQHLARHLKKGRKRKEKKSQPWKIQKRKKEKNLNVQTSSPKPISWRSWFSISRLVVVPASPNSGSPWVSIPSRGGRCSVPIPSTSRISITPAIRTASARGRGSGAIWCWGRSGFRSPPPTAVSVPGGHCSDRTWSGSRAHATRERSGRRDGSSGGGRGQFFIAVIRWWDEFRGAGGIVWGRSASRVGGRVGVHKRVRGRAARCLGTDVPCTSVRVGHIRCT